MYNNYDDETLVMLTLTGETKAYEVLVKRYQNTVIGCAFSAIQNRFFAEDAAQDAFVTAWMKLDSLEDRAKFLPWVKRIAKNCAINLITRYKSALNIDDFTGLSDGNNVSPEEICVLNEESEDIRRTVENLPDKTRLVIKYHYFDDLTISQIAEKMSISEGTVKGQLHDGRRKLRKELCAMNEKLNDTLVQKVMKKVEELKLWQLKTNKKGFDKVYKDTLKAVEELPESQVKYHAMADVLSRGFWWIKGKKNDELLEKIKETALLGKNEEVMEYILKEEAKEIYDGTTRREFIKNKQIPYLEENRFTSALADAYIRLGLLYYGAGSNDDGDAALDKAYDLLDESSLNRAYIPVAKKQKEIFDAEYKDMGADDRHEFGVSGHANELRFVDGTLRYWDERECGGGYMRGYPVIMFASRCDGYFTIDSFSVGQSYENEDGETLTYASDNETVITPCGTFEGCKLWVTRISATDYEQNQIMKNYYKQGVGIVRQDVVRNGIGFARLLNTYYVKKSNSLLPLEKGNSWEYVIESPHDTITSVSNISVDYADGERVITSAVSNTKRNFYDETCWDDMMLWLIYHYYDENDGRGDGLNKDIPHYLGKLKELAETPTQKAHTKHLSAMLERIMATDKYMNPNAQNDNIWTFFEKSLVLKRNDEIKANWYFGSIAWKNAFGNMAETPVLFNRVLPILNNSADCIWSDSWQSMENKTIEHWQFSDELVKTEISSSGGGTVTTKAGTFNNCLKLTINSDAEKSSGHDYLFGRMHFYFAKGIGIVKFQKEYMGGSGIATYELCEYVGTDDGTYMPLCDGITRKYEAIDLTDGYMAGCEYTVCTDEYGDTHIYADYLGERKKRAPVTSYSFIQDEVLEDELLNQGKDDEARFRNSVNNFKLLMHLVYRYSPNYGKEERAVAWGKTRLKYLDSSFENGEIPPALYGMYASTCFVVACPMFGAHTMMFDEAFSLLDKAFEYRKKWDEIPDGTMLDVGNELVFGGIKIKKGDERIYLPDGSFEYFDYGDRLNPQKDIMYNAMTAKSGWEWFNPIRDDERFKERIKVAKQIAEK